VKAVIAVGSGKGGVGKSTVAVNLAAALARMGQSVGLLDADIYGPSVPIMMGMKSHRPTMLADERTIVPVERYGIHAISMGFLLKESDAVVWRGPMLAKALQQFIEDVDWGTKDVLVIDLPPGTGDVQLSLTQLVPLTGAVVVTTPQDVAMADVRRAIRMFEMTKIPILGVVENMAYFRCPDNGKDYYVFGKGRTEEACRQMDIPLLARLPLDMQIGPAADAGQPIVVADPQGEQAALYQTLAEDVQRETRRLLGEREARPSFDDFFAAKPGGKPQS
jgi:ATP-binding protein involved in chromosome partitioning